MNLAFLKPESDIFKQFDKLTDVLLESGWELSQMPNNFPASIKARAQKMRVLENDADKAAHEIIDRINKSFVTPLDREDLHLLATRIDDVIDHAENAVSNIVLYDVRELREPLPEFCFTIYKASKEIAEAVHKLRNLKNAQRILDHNIKIHTLESCGDELLKKALRNLFKEENNAKEVIKWKDIFESFEKSLDMAEDVANVVEGIIIKNT